MRDFFKPWRRKIGVMTLGLGLACLSEYVKTIDAHWPLAGQPAFDLFTICTLLSAYLLLLLSKPRPKNQPDDTKNF